MAIWQPPFDASRDFEARTFFRAGGVIWERGKAFDKAAVNERVLRQLYESRKIDYATEATKVRAPVPAGDGNQLTPAVAAAAATSTQIENEALADAAGAAPAGELVARDAAALQQLDHDGDGEPGGSKPVDPADDELKARRLVSGHNHDELFKMASGIAGVTKEQTKAQIAAALVKAGRGTA